MLNPHVQLLPELSLIDILPQDSGETDMEKNNTSFLPITTKLSRSINSLARSPDKPTTTTTLAPCAVQTNSPKQANQQVPTPYSR